MKNSPRADPRADAVTFTAATKSYGSLQALAGLDFALRPATTTALLGRNGAGKSTAVNLLLGLDVPDSGSVHLFGDDPARAVRAGRVGAMLQEGRPIPRVTVREMVAFVAKTYPAPMPVDEALDLAGIREFGDRRADRLSGGQIQRVRFAIALVGDPELVVLDEPTAALDVEARRALWDSMRRFAARGNTVLFSTHYLTEADENADRILVLDRGRLVADGTSDALKRSAGGNLVSFDLAGRPADGLSLLPGVTEVEIHGDRARLRTDDSDATVVALVGLRAVRDLEVGRATLEDAFLGLTGSDADSAAGPSADPSSDADAALVKEAV